MLFRSRCSKQTEDFVVGQASLAPIVGVRLLHPRHLGERRNAPRLEVLVPQVLLLASFYDDVHQGRGKDVDRDLERRQEREEGDAGVRRTYEPRLAGHEVELGVLGGDALESQKLLGLKSTSSAQYPGRCKESAYAGLAPRRAEPHARVRVFRNQSAPS